MRKASVWLAGVAVAFTVVACNEQPAAPGDDVSTAGEITLAAGSSGADQAAIDAIRETMTRINADLAAQGVDYRAAVAEYVTSGDDADHMGQVVFFSDRGNKRLSHDFIPGDPRRPWGDASGTGITWINDLFDGATDDGETAGDTDGAIQSAMETWQNVTCSEIPLINLGSFGFDFGIVQTQFGLGGSGGFVFADVTHAGWVPRAFFDTLVPPDPPDPPGGDFILGVTISFFFCDPCFPEVVFTDADGNGRFDTALREIYYNDGFEWGVPGNPGLGAPFDVETVVLHEAGHGLSQGHFGKVFRTVKNGKLHFAPRAVMNAAITGRNVDITGSDLAGHCADWGNWPNS